MANFVIETVVCEGNSRVHRIVEEADEIDGAMRSEKLASLMSRGESITATCWLNF